MLAENPQTSDEQIPEPFAVPPERIRSTSASQEMPSRGSRGARTPPGRGSATGDNNKLIKNFETLQQSGRKSVDNEFQEYVFRELRDLKLQLEEQRGRNRNLEAKVEHLEDVVEQKQKMIHNLTDLISTVTDELRRVKEELGFERNQTRQQIAREMTIKFEELERNMARKSMLQKTEPQRDPYRDLNGPRLNSHNYSGSKAKNSESSLRQKQQGLADLIGQLKEAIELRVALRNGRNTN